MGISRHKKIGIQLHVRHKVMEESFSNTATNLVSCLSPPKHLFVHLILLGGRGCGVEQ